MSILKPWPACVSNEACDWNPSIDSDEYWLGICCEVIVYQGGTTKEIIPEAGNIDFGLKLTNSLVVTASFYELLASSTSVSRITACWKDEIVVSPATTGSEPKSHPT